MLKLLKTIMVDSLNARRVKMSYFDFRALKKEMKEKIVCKDAEIVTSEYFQHFDTYKPKNMSNRQEYYLDIAAKVAMKSSMNHKHGAIIVYKKQIIASGYNYYFGENSIHAEVAAISKMNKKYNKFLNESELYVVRIGTNNFCNLLKYSRPCLNCQNFITKKKIKSTFYSTNYDYDTALLEFLEEKKKIKH